MYCRHYSFISRKPSEQVNSPFHILIHATQLVEGKCKFYKDEPYTEFQTRLIFFFLGGGGGGKNWTFNKFLSYDCCRDKNLIFVDLQSRDVDFPYCMPWRCRAPKSTKMWHVCVFFICRYLSKLALPSCHSLWSCSVWCLSVRVLEALLDPLAGAWSAVWEQRQQTRITELHRYRDQWPWLQWGLSGSVYSLSGVLHED